MESQISLGFGHKLITPKSPAVSYIKLVNAKDQVIRQWDYWEWQGSPMLIMGEIISQIASTFVAPLPKKTKHVFSKNKNLIHLKEFNLEEMFMDDIPRKKYSIIRPFQSSEVYSVKMTSQRYRLFKKSSTCIICGLKGTRVFLDYEYNGDWWVDKVAHFNLYGEENGALVVFGKDHILPKSKKGSNTLDNYQTMCCICNNLRGNSEISNEELRLLRQKFRAVN